MCNMGLASYCEPDIESSGAKEIYSLNSVLCFEHVSKFTFKASFPFISNISPISLSISYPIRDVSDLQQVMSYRKGKLLLRRLLPCFDEVRVDCDSDWEIEEASFTILII